MSSPATAAAPTNNAEKAIIKGTLLVTSTLTVMAGATVAPALPAMRTAFAGVPNVELWVRLVLTLPALFIAVLAPVAGFIVDRVGRKPILITSIVLYGLAGASGAVAGSLTLILVGRALLGIAVAGLMTSVTTLIADYFDGARRAAFLGIQAGFMGLGGVVFLSFGGFLADLGWRMPFLIYTAAFVVLPFALFALFEPDVSAEAHRAADAPPEALPLGLMAFGYTLIVLIQLVFYAIPVQLPFYLEVLVGAGGTQSGLAIAALSLFYAISSSLFGTFNRRLTHYTMVIMALAVTGGAFGLLYLAQGWPLIILGLVVGGAGIGLLMPNINVWLASRAPAAARGRVLSGFTMSVFLGQFLSPFVVQPLVAATGDGGSYGIIGAALLGLAVVVTVLRRPLQALIAD